MEGGVRRLLSAHCCAFHRNVEISSRYAWIYKLQPACFKWSAMAAIASHHVRLALFPLRLDTDGSGYLDIDRSLDRRRMLLTEDVNTIRATNNAIFDDIFWVHLAYVTADDGDRTPASAAAGRAALRPTPRRLRGDRPRTSGPGRQRPRPRQLDGRPMTSSGPATSSFSSTSSAPWCNPTSIDSRAPSPGSSRSARPRASMSMACGTRSPTSPRSTSPRSDEGSPRPCGHDRGRGSPASRTAGGGSRRASFPASEGWTPTRAWSTPACNASSTMTASSRRRPASTSLTHRRSRPGAGTHRSDAAIGRPKVTASRTSAGASTPNCRSGRAPRASFTVEKAMRRATNTVMAKI